MSVHPMATLPRKPRYRTGHQPRSATETGVGGTYLFLNVSLLLAEKTFYIYENRKFVENNITPTNSSSPQSILPLPTKQREQKET